jgi:hypothetical protein
MPNQQTGFWEKQNQRIWNVLQRQSPAAEPIRPGTSHAPGKVVKDARRWLALRFSSKRMPDTSAELAALAEFAEPTLLSPPLVIRVHDHAYRLSEAEHGSASTPELLDVFDGVLERIDSEGIAHVTFTNPEGKTATAEIKATQLTSRGIRELDRFQCEIKATPESIILTMFPLPPYQLTDADYLKIQEDLDKVIPDSTLDKRD